VIVGVLFECLPQAENASDATTSPIPNMRDRVRVSRAKLLFLKSRRRRPKLNIGAARPPDPPRPALAGPVLEPALNVR
jgi:hypothetical protein